MEKSQRETGDLRCLQTCGKKLCGSERSATEIPVNGGGVSVDFRAMPRNGDGLYRKRCYGDVQGA